ncbi:MAG: hypothetical protein IMZ62_16665 [Chloroflexi bacterium]|nr:hypothetical protein [Chloroflexota bacterium]
MSIPRLTQLAEKWDLENVESRELVYALAGDLDESLSAILVQLKKLNLQAVALGGDEIDDADVIEE